MISKVKEHDEAEQNKKDKIDFYSILKQHSDNDCNEHNDFKQNEMQVILNNFINTNYHPDLKFISKQKINIINQDQGSYGQVYKARSKINNEVIAIKIIQRLFEDNIDSKRVLREICILKNLDHPNVIKLNRVITLPDKTTNFQFLIIETEYCHWDLRKFMKMNSHLQMNIIAKIMFDLLKALLYLADKNIVHRDIKSQNILIRIEKNQYQAVLCDFGMARDLSTKQSERKEYVKKIQDQDNLHKGFIDNNEILKENGYVCRNQQNIKYKKIIDSVPEKKIKRSSKNFQNDSIDDITFTQKTKYNIFDQDQESYDDGEQNQKEYLQDKNELNVFTNQITKKHDLNKNKKFDFNPNKIKIMQNNEQRTRKQNKVDFDQLNRCLTKYFGTRYYRSPEIVLLQNYDFKIDIWALGCVFGELLQKSDEYSNINILPSPLFQSQSCFPMSPLKKSFQKDYVIDNKDHLKVIFDMIGYPQIKDLDFIKEKKTFFFVQNYLKNEERDFPMIEQLFQNVNKKAYQLLLDLLKFNPQQRISSFDCINHQFFKQYKLNCFENYSIKNQQQISLDFECDHFHLQKNELQLLFYRQSNNNQKITGKYGIQISQLLNKIQNLNLQ